MKCNSCENEIITNTIKEFVRRCKKIKPLFYNNYEYIKTKEIDDILHFMLIEMETEKKEWN